MRKLWWGILAVGCLGCVTSKATYREVYDPITGNLVSIESSIEKHQRIFGPEEDVRSMEMKTKEWTLKAGAESSSGEGEIADTLRASGALMLEAFKAGGAPIP